MRVFIDYLKLAAAYTRLNLRAELIVLSVAAGALFVGFCVMTASLSFYLGRGGALSEQWRGVMLALSTYPTTLFSGAVKVLLFTLIPAGFVSTLPVDALRELSLWNATLAIAGSVGVLAAGTGVFYHGLCRHESGNLLAMRE